MFTLEIVVPKQHVPEKFDRFIASSRIKVKETGEYVKLTRSAVPKILALKSVIINGQPLKDKSTKVKPNDTIVITLANIDSFKVDQVSQLKSEEQENQLKQKQIQSKPKTTPTQPKVESVNGEVKKTQWWENRKEKEPEVARPHSQIKKQPAKKPQNNSQQPQVPQYNNSGNFKLVGTNIKLDIVYEDDDLAIINKPAGMLVHPVALTLGSNALLINKEDQTHTLVNALIHRYGGIEGLSSIGGIERPGIVHRLDKDTAGMIIIARNNISHQKLQTLFEKHTSTMIQHTTIDQYEDNGSISNNQIERMLVGKKIPTTIQKKYHCLVLGKPKEPHGFINKKIARHPGDKNKMVIDEYNGKEALTEYKVLQVWENVNAQVLDNQRNKVMSKSSIPSSTSTSGIVNSTLSEYDSVMSQLNKNKKKKNIKKSTVQVSKNLNSKMQFLSVDSDSDEDDDKEDEDKEQEKVEEEDESEEDESEEDESEKEEEDESEKEEEDESEEDESEDEEENYDEILLRLQQKTKMIAANTFSLLEVTLHTGRSHQIRVHMASENIPIVGDPIYSSKSKQFLVPYLLLASMSLRFVHPILNEIKEFSIQYPSHFKNFISTIDGKPIEEDDDENNNDDSEDDEEDSEDEEDVIVAPVSKSKKSKSKFSTPLPTNNNNNTKKKNNQNYVNSLNINHNLEKDLLSDFVKNKK